MSGQVALITGITGQDASYLAELLLEKDYDVVGVKRRSSTNNLWRLHKVLNDKRFHLVDGDVTDSASMYNLVDFWLPDLVFNTAAQSFVKDSFDQPQYTSIVDYIGVINILEAMRLIIPQSRFIQFSTSEMFGNNVDENGYQNEDTKFAPRSPYGIAKIAAHNICKLYRDSYDMFACCPIMFNHESPRRGEEFVTRKITKWIGDNYNKLKEKNIDYFIEDNKLKLGNLDACRDFGHSKDYMRAVYMMSQQQDPKDFVVATGETHSIRDILDIAFDTIGINDWSPYIGVDQRFMRPAEVPYLRGDASRINKVLEWTPKISFKQLIEEMVYADIGDNGLYSTMIQNIKITADLDREELFELGRKSQYYKFVDFPIEVTEEIKALEKLK